MSGSTAEVISLAEHRHAARSTVDALMYTLRGGLLTLTSHNPRQDDVLHQLQQLTEEQFAGCCALLRVRKPPIGPAWSDAEIETLTKVWRKVRYDD